MNSLIIFDRARRHFQSAARFPADLKHDFDSLASDDYQDMTFPYT
jgi:hypothetical protein